MRAVLMAGGAGTRLRPLTCTIPKAMVPILNRPIAEHIINLLKRHNIIEIVATLYYLPDAIQDYFQDGSDFGVQMTYVVEKDQPLGTVGCLKNIAELLNDTFLVISGDRITDCDLTAAIEFHKSKKSKATLVLYQVSDPIGLDVVLTDKNYRIRRLLEKPLASELFSDLVSTGIYILEPTVLNYLPENTESDFSQELFPLLLQHDEPIYGYRADGYWSHVGHLDAYRKVNYDALQRKVKLDLAYGEQKPGLWVGQNTFIDPTAKIETPVLIGNNCHIGSRVTIEAGTVIGDNVTVGADADLKRPILWNESIVGDEAYLIACVMSQGTRVDRRAHVGEGAVVGALSIVGEEAQVNPGVRVWPHKQIESGAILNNNLVWGDIAQRHLFSQYGIQGLANIDITPEFTVKLGAAYGSTLKPGSQVLISRDQQGISRMISRSLMAGLMSVGVNVQNLEGTGISIARLVLPKLGVVGGLHVRLHPDQPDSVLIEIFDSQGINISKAKEKTIERAYFQEGLRRAQIHEIGNVGYPSSIIEPYYAAVQKYLNIEAIHNGRGKVVIDYAFGVSGPILPGMLGKFGYTAMVLNATLMSKLPTLEEREELLNQLGQVVEALRATFGVQMLANGERLILMDEAGMPIRGEILTALMTDMMLTAHPRGTVVVPVHASSAIEQIARKHDGNVIRTKSNPKALMEASSTNPNVILGGSGEMGFIFPQLHPGFDAVFCVCKLIEMLTLQGRSLSQIRSKLPRVYHRTFTFYCPRTVHQSLMCSLIETYTENKNTLELIDGVKIVSHQPEQWVLILPDEDKALVHIFANGNDRIWVDKIIKDCSTRIRELVPKEKSL